MRNIGLKLFSIGIALVLAWYVHSESNNSVKTFVASVDLRHVPAGHIVVSPVNPTVQVTVKGPSFIVSRIANSPLVFPISFPEQAGDHYRTALDPNALLLPPYVEVLTTEPPEIEFSLEKLISRELTVVVPRIGTLDDALHLDSVTVSPEHIEATGPQSELTQLGTLETEPLDLHTVHQSVRLMLALRTVAPLTKFSADHVAVNVDVSPIVNSRAFGNIPLEIHTRPGARYRVDPASADVVISGPKKEIAALQRNDIQAYVRLTDGAAEQKDAAVQIEVSAGLHVDSVDPQRVKVLVLPELKKDAARAVKKH